MRNFALCLKVFCHFIFYHGSFDFGRARDSFELNEGNRLTTRRKSIEETERQIQTPDATGLIIRNLPNYESKVDQQHRDCISPFLCEAIDFIVEIGLKYLLVDLPSIDRIFYEGKLSNQRKFWGLNPVGFIFNTCLAFTLEQKRETNKKVIL